MKGRNLWKNSFIVVGCILLNILGRYLSDVFGLPLRLDFIGTFVAAYYGNAFTTILCASLGSLFFWPWNPPAPGYAVVSSLLALSARFCVKRGYAGRLSTTVATGFWLGVLRTLLTVPLNLFFLEGHCGNMWGDALYSMLEWRGSRPLLCAFSAEALISLIDMQLCAYFAYAMIHGILSGKKCAKGLLPFLVVCLFLIPGESASAHVSVQMENYVGKILNSSNGMISSEANVIEEMPDGTIWIGSYAGLTRYDGRQTRFITEGGISSVTAMYVDTKGRMWIGTNDNGVVRYEEDEFHFLKTRDGLPVNSIRCFAEAQDGSMFVGTTDRLCRITTEDAIEIVSEKYTYVTSLAIQDGYLFGVDNKGKLFAMTLEGEEVPIREDFSKVFFNCVEETRYGIAAGTSGHKIYMLEKGEDGVEISEQVMVSITDIISMEEGRDGRLWVCAGEGFGYVNQQGCFEKMYHEGFDSSFEWIHEDYQGNIWLASSRYGVLKLSRSGLGDVFSNAGLDARVVNAVTEYEWCLYCGTDSGLVIIDTNDNKEKKNKLTQMLDGVRIRSLMVDSQNVLWISSYSDYGLISYDSNGNITTYNMENNHTTSNRFRCILETTDRTIVAGTADGINFIRDGKVENIITAEDGLQNSQILCLVQDKSGVIYACSDGAGIYLIQDGKIIGNYCTEDGLTSDVVLRMVPYRDRFFIVTSNALCILENGTIHKLASFPYFNNYDIVIREEEAFVLSSAGIYRVNAEQLAADAVESYELYNVNQGLTSGLTANSWNFLDEDNTLYFCGNSGVISFQSGREVSDVPVKYGIAGISCDGVEIYPRDGVYEIPADAKLISVEAAVMNYTLSDIGVRMFVEGTDSDLSIQPFQLLEPLQLANLTHGEYVLHLQLYNDEQKMISESVYHLNKQAQVWEDTGFRIYLIFAVIEIIVFLTWNFILMVNNSKRKEELEHQRRELQEQVSIQTAEIRNQQEKTNRLFMDTVIALSDAVDAKDRYTSGHSKRVACVAMCLAERLGKSGEEQDEIYFAGLLHDIGKIGIPREIINKPGKLTLEEREIINIHPVTGFHILKGISEVPAIAVAARFHHERYDGTGYPNGLKGEDIPEIARIIGVADTYDAMASNRSYRKRLPKEVIVEEMKRVRGAQLDPVITDAMLDLLSEGVETAFAQQEDMVNDVLIINGDAEETRMIREALQEEDGNRVLSAADGAMALKILATERVDLVCLDMDTPGLDGYEMLKRIKENHDIPVVFMAKSAKSEELKQAKEYGVNDYLTKPLSRTILKEVVYSCSKSL